MTDESKRELGIRSSMALEGLEITVWRRSVETMKAAEAEYDSGSLTPERAQALLVALLEQRKLLTSLRAQVEEGIRANTRLAKRFDGDFCGITTMPVGNRFVQSRANRLPPADAAS